MIRFETPPQRTACPVAKKAIFENRESDQLVARLDNANFGLEAVSGEGRGLRYRRFGKPDEPRPTLADHERLDR